jgi:PTH1 family peptidyl-tRNA hydrolase
LIVGLGNPGREYAGTRHNVGFMVLDQISRSKEAPFRHVKEWQADVASDSGTYYCKPMSFMNRSGRPLGSICRYYKISPEDVLIVYDDVALPLGKLRIRRGGSAGSHNGLQSVIDHLGSTSIPRLRIGIGAAENSGNMISHVLGAFSEKEHETVTNAVDRACEAVETIQRQGLEAAMNQYNQSTER